jgi:carbon-monoxide dehydrogenase large subunit
MDPVGIGARVLDPALAPQLLASEVVRYVGEPVVAIVAAERAQGVDASELVVIDYEPLPAVIDPEAARRDETLLFPEVGTNTCFSVGEEPAADFFNECEVVISHRFVNQRVAPCPLEVRAAAARWEPDGRLSQWASTQRPHGMRDELARVLQLPLDQVRVIAPDVGGGFGAKFSRYPEELLVAWLARRVGRPVRWMETRSESMSGLGHGRAQIQEVTLGGDRSGKLHAYALSVIQDAGAYARVGAMLPIMTEVMVQNVYEIEKIAFSSVSVLTNTTPTTAYRGAGRPEAICAIERAIDLYATEIGMDPAEVRRRNLIAADAFPYTTRLGVTYDVGEFERAFDLCLDSAGYGELREEQVRRRKSDERLQLGIGLSLYIEITNMNPGGEFGAVTITAAGKALVRTGSAAHGQGHQTAFSMIVAEALGIPMTDIEVIAGDTDLVPRGIGTFGSRSLQTGGLAVHDAAAVVLERGRSLFADEMEASLEDVIFDTATGQFSIAGSPSITRGWAELAGREESGAIAAEVDYASPGPTFPFGAHLAVVEVDLETGKVTLMRLVAVEDAGRILNPLLAEGQVHGGIAQGVAQALFEEVVYDEQGNLLTSNFADYSIITAAELPSFETFHTVTPTPRNALGAKGIGESGTIGATPAVHNAVIDALAHLGVSHVAMPTSPERVWRAIRDART